MTGIGGGCDEGKRDVAYYEAKLFRLDGHRFLDLTARSEDVCQMCVAIHWIFLVDTDNDSFSLTPIDSDWLKNAKGEKTVAVATVQGDTNKITASPKERKAFCRKYADAKAAFKPIPGYTFKKKQHV